MHTFCLHHNTLSVSFSEVMGSEHNEDYIDQLQKKMLILILVLNLSFYLDSKPIQRLFFISTS